MIKYKRIFLGLVLAFLVLFASAFTSTVLAGHPSRPDNVFSVPVPVGTQCPVVFQPVHDIFGSTYRNACYAALDGVRVTWNGISL